MKGCLTFILAIIALVIIFQNFIAFIGIVIAGWAIYEWRKNRELSAKSKVPAIILTIGLVIFFVGFSSNSEEIAQESNVNEPQTEEVEMEEPENEELETPTNNVENVEAIATVQEDEPVPEESQFIYTTVTNIVDGDTIDVDLDGQEERIRLILVDTPETRHPDKPVQPFGEEATAYSKQMLEGKEVKLEFDVQERDQYGRLLAYVWVGDQLFNQLLIEKGLARVAVYPPNTKYVDEFREHQEKTQQEQLGIWSIENYATDSGFNDIEEEKEEPVPTPEPQPAAPVETVHYKNCTAAREAGAAPVYRGDPGYASHLDRDGDGIGCE